MFACIHAPGNLPILLDCARHFSPLIEVVSPDTVVFDVSGLQALYGAAISIAHEIERLVGLPAQIAIAANPDAAVHAGRGFSGTTVIPPGKEAAVLAPLPLHLLGGSAEIAELLDLWGIRTFGELARLPPLGLAARVGEEGMHLQRLARGEGYRRLRPLEEPPQFAAALESDYPIESLESLAFLLGRLLSDVCRQLAAQSLATNEIRLRLQLENAPDHVAALRFPVPMLHKPSFLKLLQLELAGRPPAAPVLKLQLAAEPVDPRRTQHGLFVPSAPEPETMEVTLARVEHIVGAGNVGSPELVDTHHPDAFLMRPFAPPAADADRRRSRPAPPPPPLMRLALRRFRPPAAAEVTLAGRQPVHLRSVAVHGKVLRARGPWRTSGDWWTDRMWNHDEWDVVLANGAAYRIFQDLSSERWFVEGGYD